MIACPSLASTGLPPAPGAREVAGSAHASLTAAIGSCCTLLWVAASAAGAAPRLTDQPMPRTVQVDRLRVFKQAHTLEAWSDGRLIKIYRVAIGRGGPGHKQHEGDGRTPEGTYAVEAKRASHLFHRFLSLSYPSVKDRASFARARRAGRLAPGARIGGAIGIHGEKRGWSFLPHKWIDWTQGCIALDNDEIEELWRAVVVDAVVEILP